MCGRFTLAERLEQLQRHYEIHEINYDYQPSYNIAPTDLITTVKENNTQNSFEQLNWGIPLKIEKLNNLVINIRDDSIPTNGFFNKMFTSNRCLIPASGFFEWKKTGSSKVPYYIKTNQEIISFAGLYYKIKDDLYSAIITTNPNDLVETLHDRMPVILSKEEEESWLDPESTHTELQSLLDPYPSELTSFYPISSKVNSVKNNFPEILKPRKASSSLSDFF